MEQQTAIEWLVDIFSKQGTLYSSDINQAKQMEKKQKEDEYCKGRIDALTKELEHLWFERFKKIIK